MRPRWSHASRPRCALAIGALTATVLLAPLARAATLDRARQVRRLLFSWRIAAAKRTAAELANRAPRDPRVRFVRGLVAFFESDYGRAVRLMAAARSRATGIASQGELDHMLALARSTAATVKGFVEHKSAGGHFLIRTAEGPDQLIAPFAAETLEEIRKRLASDLGYAPTAPVVVEIYGKPADLARVSPLTEQDIRRSGTVALCKYNRLMIVTPRALLRGYSWRDTLAHEYVHLAVSRLSHNNVPIWLHEGLAKHFEARWRLAPGQQPPLSPAQRHLLAGALERKRLIRWRQMHPSMAKLPDQRSTALAFAQVQTAIGFIAAKLGKGGLRRLVLTMRDGSGDWTTIRRLTKLTRASFNSGWRSYLRQLDLRVLPGLIPKQLRFGKPNKERRIAAIKVEKARGLFRLADMLRRRSHLQAAIIEYRKALALAGPRQALIANALARAELENNAPKRAVAALRPVIQYYPELAGPQATLGVALARTGARQEATSHLLAALRINPFNPEIHCELQRLVGDPARAKLHARLCGTR